MSTPLIITTVIFALAAAFYFTRRKKQPVVKYQVQVHKEANTFEREFYRVLLKHLSLQGKALPMHDKTASLIAMQHCLYMHENMSTSHDNAQIRREQLSTLGATYISEITNIKRSVNELFSTFLGSPEHKKIIDKNNYNAVGIGIYQGRELLYCTILFFKA